MSDTADPVLTVLAIDDNQKLDDSLIEKFKSNVIHPVLAEVGKMRPAVDISVT